MTWVLTFVEVGYVVTHAMVSKRVSFVKSFTRNFPLRDMKYSTTCWRYTLPAVCGNMCINERTLVAAAAVVVVIVVKKSSVVDVLVVVIVIRSSSSQIVVV